MRVRLQIHLSMNIAKASIKFVTLMNKEMDIMKRHLRTWVLSIGIAMLLVVALMFPISATNIRRKVINNPDIRKEFQNGVEKRMPEEPPMEKSEGKQRSHKKNEGKDKDGESVDEYYKSIIDNNLFRALGWVYEKKKRGPDFRLIGTVIVKGKQARALIFEFANNTTYYVAMGDKIGNATVKAIGEKSVTLEKDGEEPITLNIVQESLFLGGSVDGKGDGNLH